MLAFRKRAVTLVVFLFLAGCSHRGHSIVGTWDIKGGPGPASITFTKDGNFKTEATMPSGTSTTSGQYKLDGDALTLIKASQLSATLSWNSDDDVIMTGHDGKAMTLARRK